MNTCNQTDERRIKKKQITKGPGKNRKKDGKENVNEREREIEQEREREREREKEREREQSERMKFHS